MSGIVASDDVGEHKRKTLDRFGFILETSRGNKQTSIAMSSVAVFLENKRERKWCQMLGDYEHAESSTTEHFSKVRRQQYAMFKRRVRKGIPNAVRSRAWHILSAADECKKKSAMGYADHLDKVRKEFSPDSEFRRSREGHEATQKSPKSVKYQWDQVIAVDLERTFPNHVMFVGDQSLHTLRALQRILRAYGMCNPDVGYTQGMNFLAGMFLTYMREEQVFWVLTAAMENPLYHLGDLYKPGTPEVPLVWHVMEKLTRKYLPKLSKHFEQEGVLPSMYLTEWVVTMYTRSFPFDFVVRIWDIFFHEGWKIFYRVALGLLKHTQDSLLKESLEGIMQIFRSLPASIDGDKVLHVAHSIPLRRAELGHLIDSYKGGGGEKHI